MKSIKPDLKDEDKRICVKLLRAGKLEHKYARRLQAVLRRAEGIGVGQVAAETGLARSSISLIINRYNEEGLDALLCEKTRKPGREPISAETVNKICALACTKPEHETHWSTRTLAKHFGVGKTTVNRILRERDIKPHIVHYSRFSNDPKFEEKLTDVAGLYMNPPDNEIVLRVDEKTQIQALERSAPILPLLPHVPQKMSRDYYRHGTTTLFAALDIRTGRVTGECKKEHKSVDFIQFLKKLDRECESGKMLHIILDNYSVHKSVETKKYLAEKKERFTVHFIATHSSWMNLVERWFAEITRKRITRESWESVEQLIAAIKDYIGHWNTLGKRFQWTKPAHEILAKIVKAKTSLISNNV